MFAVITGNALSGFKLTGPFTYPSQAHRYGLVNYGDGRYVVAPMDDASDVETPRVLVHRNVEEGGYWIRRGMEDARPRKSGTVYLTEVRWVVWPEIQRRARMLKAPIPHAFAEGYPIGHLPTDGRKLRKVIYRPQEHDTFVYQDTGKPALPAPWAILNPEGVFVP